MALTPETQFLAFLCMRKFVGNSFAHTFLLPFARRLALEAPNSLGASCIFRCLLLFRLQLRMMTVVILNQGWPMAGVPAAVCLPRAPAAIHAIIPGVHHRCSDASWSPGAPRVTRSRPKLGPLGAFQAEQHAIHDEKYIYHSTGVSGCQTQTP